MEYFVKEVTTRKEMNDFVRLPSIIYKGNACYVPDMESDVRAIFKEPQHSAHAESLRQAFVVYDNNGAVVGRVVGIINRKANEIWNTKYVRFGMIEFIDDLKVSAMLIHAVEMWGAYHGMTSIQGPMGLTDFDKEGMLVEDFDEVGSMVTIYNPAYYPVHMEQLEFVKEADWIQARFDVPKRLPDRFIKTVRLVREMYDLNIRKLTLDEVRHGGYGKRIFALLNKAYRPLFGFAELSDESIDKFLDQYMPLADLRMIPVVEDSQGNIVAVAVTMASMTNALQKSRGRMFPFGWFHLFRSLKLKHEDKAELLLIAVDPDVQGMGINALLFEDLVKVYNELGYRWAETGPMLETNQKVLSQWHSLDARFYKRRRCYGKEIKLFGNV